MDWNKDIYIFFLNCLILTKAGAVLYQLSDWQSRSGSLKFTRLSLMSSQTRTLCVWKQWCQWSWIYTFGQILFGLISISSYWYCHNCYYQHHHMHYILYLKFMLPVCWWRIEKKNTFEQLMVLYLFKWLLPQGGRWGPCSSESNQTAATIRASRKGATCKNHWQSLCCWCTTIEG